MKMLRVLAVILITVFGIVACNPYKVQPLQNNYIKQLNDSLTRAQNHQLTWANSPGDIGKHFFPRLDVSFSSNSYELESKSLSASHRRVIITNEVVSDKDSIAGTRHIIDFELNNNRWVIRDVRLELKRR